MLLTALAAALDDEECRDIGLAPFTLFINLASHLRPRIQWMTKDPTTPPVTLDKPVAALLAHASQLTVDTVERLWSRLRLFLWALPSRSSDALQDSLGLHEIFMTAGLHFEIGFCDLFPPTTVCLDPHCNVAGGTPRTLANPLSYKITLFSRDLGPLPAWCYSLNCPRCFTRYYPTYFVHSNRGLRTYYPYFNVHEIHVIEVATHYYIEASLARRFTNMSVCSWVSSTNNAKIYNLEYDSATMQAVANGWDFSVEMSSDMAMDGLLLLGLLRDTVERQVMLTLNQHAPNNHDRLRPALEERTARMVGPGQEYWNHACTGCCEVNQDTKQALRAVVTDGIAMGHACCGVHDCQIPLASQRARFCPTHSEQNLKCAVVGCSAPTERPYKTCNNSVHRELENRGEESRTALFQLKRRLERQKLAVPSDAFADTVSNDDESVEVDCPEKSEEGNHHTTKLRISLGRSWSHNEEICVGCCGMILGRATFFGSEAPNAVRIFHRILFPTKASLPSVMFYDDNCHVKAVINKIGDRHFDDVGLPVDVFHMKTKHKASDDSICSLYCNPANFPDLYRAKKWRFNSSAAEVTNAWFGGFRSIVREMRVDRYNFFLDEMIKERNRILVKELKKRHACPYLIPRKDLLHGEYVAAA